MRSFLIKLGALFLQQAKFAAAGLVATSIDYFLYLLLVHSLFTAVPSNVISYSIAMVINFLLQRRFVFSLQGSAFITFVLSAMVSMGGLLLSTAIIYGLIQLPFYQQRQYLTKLIAIVIVFFYNFYLKRYVFENRFKFKWDFHKKRKEIRGTRITVPLSDGGREAFSVHGRQLPGQTQKQDGVEAAKGPQNA